MKSWGDFHQFAVIYSVYLADCFMNILMDLVIRNSIS